ncbi:prepilin-type cleavage/methylation domain-containing protein [Nitrosophilus labii]|uniref:prepilin-type cleavage/methylation domain-containing protein n=1 Tax=Nitrosophilus labii TaxID=2706014 RepID=UPI0016572FAD|nr:prepilin-type cleavage/methylation domain-containing protein [Nitrosophilus labii]
MKKSFTLVELIFIIVIIGILAAVAIPKFTGLTSNTKISSELATASTIQSAIEDVHSEWIMSEGTFNWGNQETTDCSDSNTANDGDFNCSSGYPILGDCNTNKPFGFILKNSSTVDAKWACKDNNDGTYFYKGPASTKNSGVNPSSDTKGKPDCSDYWIYDIKTGTFSLKDVADQTCTNVNEL